MPLHKPRIQIAANVTPLEFAHEPASMHPRTDCQSYLRGRCLTVHSASNLYEFLNRISREWKNRVFA
ncbi:hypothetical protein CO661_31165 [Sinorhizobium fredii]|uniref:Uncharacterized protein n=1 Tax=Rhizobium fredii TaxID=380 RepID=A0A2A6LN88_RHIFR|nr:hypothetical protein CO661_31165 [Sinorhizobium fredii]